MTAEAEEACDHDIGSLHNRKDWCPESFSLKNFLFYAKYAAEQKLEPTITDHDGLKRKHYSFITG